MIIMFEHGVPIPITAFNNTSFLRKMSNFRVLRLSCSVVHNHPSGDPTPSHADIEMTKEVAKVAKTLGIQLYDHVIVGKDGHASLKGLKLI